MREHTVAASATKQRRVWQQIYACKACTLYRRAACRFARAARARLVAALMDAGDVRSIVLDDGRQISFAEYGKSTGYPVVALHGTPGSRLKFRSMHEAAVLRGLRIISVDRWGYGGTDMHPRPSLAAFAADAGALAERLSIDRFGVVGISGGGPFATAVAAVLGPQVERLALVCPVGLVTETPAVEMAAMHRFAFGILPRLPGAGRLVFAVHRRLVLSAPGLAVAATAARASASDHEVLADRNVRACMVDAMRVGLARNARGPAGDLALFGRTWNVRPAAISATTKLWLGADDGNVPNAAARLLASRISGSQVRVLAGHGHFWIMRDCEEVLDWLAGRPAQSWIAHRCAPAARLLPAPTSASAGSGLPQRPAGRPRGPIRAITGGDRGGRAPQADVGTRRGRSIRYGAARGWCIRQRLARLAGCVVGTCHGEPGGTFCGDQHIHTHRSTPASFRVPDFRVSDAAFQFGL